MPIKWVLNIEFGELLENSNEKQESGHTTLSKCYVQGAPQKKQYDCFFLQSSWNFQNKQVLYMEFD